MFCPRCGQQAAEEVRFCSRCGLPLDAAAEVVAAGGSPEWYLARTEAVSGGGALTPRQKGTRQGLTVTVGGLLFFGVVILLTAYKEDFFPFLIPAGIVLILGVTRMLYALLAEGHKAGGKSSKRVAAAEATAAELVRGGARRKGLPDTRTVPASLYTDTAANTSDMSASPLSVTEGTTRLLEEEDARRGRQ